MIFGFGGFGCGFPSCGGRGYGAGWGGYPGGGFRRYGCGGCGGGCYPQYRGFTRGGCCRRFW